MLFTKVRNVKSPSRGTPGSAGFDFFVPEDSEDNIAVYPGDSINIPSGIKLFIPEDHVGIFFNKSSWGSKGLQVGACVVDSDYRGEVHLNVHNMTKDRIWVIKPGQKLVQMVVMPISTALAEIPNDEYDAISNTQRGTGGFGSTGA